MAKREENMFGWFAKNLPFVGAIAKEFDKFCPQIEDEVSVTVQGQPGSTKRRMYLMALATCSGIARRLNTIAPGGVFLVPPPGLLMVEYDAADNWVRCTMRYQTGTLGLSTIGGGLGASDPVFDNLPVYNGPDCEVVGKPLNFTGTLAGIPIPGIPRSAQSGPSIPLEFAEKTVLSACPRVPDPDPLVAGNAGPSVPSSNPKPPGDNRSRGAVVVTGATTSTMSGTRAFGPPTETPKVIPPCCAVSLQLVPLVYAALTDPGSFGKEIFAAPQSGPTGA